MITIQNSKQNLQVAKSSKSVPGFDVIDYGQEDYVFGNSKEDAKHWNNFLLKVLQENQE